MVWFFKLPNQKQFYKTPPLVAFAFRTLFPRFSIFCLILIVNGSPLVRLGCLLSSIDHLLHLSEEERRRGLREWEGGRKEGRKEGRMSVRGWRIWQKNDGGTMEIVVEVRNLLVHRLQN